MEKEKQLLLKDLCSRLPYGVLCDFVYNIGHPQKLLSISLHKKYQIHLDSDEYVFDSGKSYGPSDTIVDDIKPYLRPMSSMTEEERADYHFYCETVWDSGEESYYHYDTFKSIDWLNEHHFDYRGLIPMGLALEAPDDMYKQ